MTTFDKLTKLHKIILDGDLSIAERLCDEIMGDVQAEVDEPDVDVPYKQLTSEIELVLSDPDSKLSPGARLALKWCLTWVSVPLQLASPTANK